MNLLMNSYTISMNPQFMVYGLAYSMYAANRTVSRVFIDVTKAGG